VLKADVKAERNANIYKDAPGGGNWTPTTSETVVAEAIFWEKQQLDLSSSTASHSRLLTLQPPAQ